MTTHLGRVSTALLLTAGIAHPATAQTAVPFTWRMGVGIEAATITTTHFLGDTGLRLPVVQVGLEHSVTPRIAVGLAWTGGWYTDRWADHRRHSFLVTASAYAWRGLHVTAGAGLGRTTFVDVEPPPEDRFGDIVVADIRDGERALALSGGVAYDIHVGPFDFEPLARILAHRLHGETLSLAMIGVHMGLRSR